MTTPKNNKLHESGQSVLHIDFECRGTLELKDVGSDVWSRHKDTDVWCMGYAFDDEEPELWPPQWDTRLWDLGEVFGHVQRGGTVVAHNAYFELCIWNNVMVPKYGWPPLKPEQTLCTMAQAYSLALPGSLDRASAAVGVPIQKDLTGNRLAIQMAKPRSIALDGTIQWWDQPEKLTALYDYCRQDVRVERELGKRLFLLSTSERKLWNIDFQINQRGVYLDTAAIKKAITVVDVEYKRLPQELSTLTENAVGFPSEIGRLKKWLESQGVSLPSVAKADVIDALKIEELPATARRVLEIRQEAGKTSTAKLTKMLEIVDQDGRARGTMQYHGASTGRWAGRRVQMHNLPRPSISHADVEWLLDHMTTDDAATMIRRMDLFYGRPMSTVADCIRGMITAAPGKVLVAADFANIEGRVLAWLAGESWKLEAFAAFDRGESEDIYKLTAGKIYGKPSKEVSKDERQIGKVAELALGYQGGVGAFQTMARGYGVVISDERADAIKVAWREAHPKIKNYWYALEEAATNAVAHAGTRYTIRANTPGAVSFLVKGSFLFCQLPSKRVLSYPYPLLKMTDNSFNEQLHYKHVHSTTNNWEETHTYGGKLAENITQAVARDILAEAIVRCEEDDWPVVLHVHDEIVAESPSVLNPKQTMGMFEILVAQNPLWAKGLPIAAAGWIGRRYRK
jgi:DNA polymerase